MPPPTPPARRAKAPPRKAAPWTGPRLAAHLHETVCQNLTGARFLLSRIRQRPPMDVTELQNQLQELEGVLDASSRELADLLKELRQ